MAVAVAVAAASQIWHDVSQRRSDV
jgi:hypothetical protein